MNSHKNSEAMRNLHANPEREIEREIERLRPAPRALRPRAFWLAAMLALALATPGCERKSPRGGAVLPGETPQSANQTGTISADPNPVPAGDGKGKTKINWSVNDGTARVYLSIDGGKEELFSGRTGEEAPWIEEGHDYEFRLYAGEEHKTELGSVKVTRSKK